LVPGMLRELHSLHAFMGHELAAHIAREEDVLFPAFRTLTADDRLIDELVVQHDRVRERRALLESVLTALDHHHDDVAEEHARLGASLEAQPRDLSWEALEKLADSVRQLDWIFQGHFGDEEDDLFAPGAELFSPADLARMTQEMEAIRPDRPA